MLTIDQAKKLFVSEYVSNELQEKNAEKLMTAIKVLGDKYILANPMKRLDKPRWN